MRRRTDKYKRERWDDGKAQEEESNGWQKNKKTRKERGKRGRSHIHTQGAVELNFGEKVHFYSICPVQSIYLPINKHVYVRKISINAITQYSVPQSRIPKINSPPTRQHIAIPILRHSPPKRSPHYRPAPSAVPSIPCSGRQAFGRIPRSGRQRVRRHPRPVADARIIPYRDAAPPREAELRRPMLLKPPLRSVLLPALIEQWPRHEPQFLQVPKTRLPEFRIVLPGWIQLVHARAGGGDDVAAILVEVDVAERGVAKESLGEGARRDGVTCWRLVPFGRFGR